MQHLAFLQISADELQAMIESAVRSVLSEMLADGITQQHPAGTDSSEMLSRTEAARMLRISLDSLRNYELRGILSPCRIGRRVLFRRDEVERALNGKR